MKPWFKKRTLFLVLIGIFTVFFVGCQTVPTPSLPDEEPRPDEIRIGLLFSTDGTSAIVEKSMLNAAIMAIEEINESGGVNGKSITYIHENYASDPAVVEEKIRKLIGEDHVVATIGCYTSSSRQATFPVLERSNSILVYPSYTEGEESHPNVIYVGAMPNQQIADFFPWLIEHCGKKVFFVGSDYRFSIICNKQGKILAERFGGTVVGEEYLPMGSSNFSNVLSKIQESDPDFIFCNLVGDSLVSFYKAYPKAGFDTSACPIASTTMDEITIRSIGDEYAEGHYISLNYFTNLDTQASQRFVEDYYARFQDGTMPIYPAETTYNSCYLLAKALEQADDPYDGRSLVKHFSGLEFDSPQGKIKVDPETHCTWQISRFAQMKDAKLQLLYESSDWIRPLPWLEFFY